MFKVKILTPTGQFGEFEVDILNCVTTTGQVGLLKNHMPYVANLAKGMINFVSNKQRRFFMVESGIVFFYENVATLLVESIVEANER